MKKTYKVTLTEEEFKNAIANYLNLDESLDIVDTSDLTITSINGVEESKLLLTGLGVLWDE